VILEEGDVVVISQKIISKAEKRVRKATTITPSKKAERIAQQTGKDSKIVELILNETEEPVKIGIGVLLVKDKRGFTCINAGIDRSNVEGEGSFALLPENPDASAEKCRRELKRLTEKNVAVIICDTYSRPFRRGQVNFAIGISGINPFKDYRGKSDLFGKILKVKNVAIVDEIAAAAELLMGQGKEAKPVIVFKGLGEVVDFRGGTATKELYIPHEDDLFKNSL
jgi:coenzyme F420-0:L-glutamate ligase/coenzyme F420-1:gamma-L-glutamate ligase